MKLNWSTKFVLIWVLCGVYNFGTTMAFFDHESDTYWHGLNQTSRDHVGISVFAAAAGPFGTVAVSLISNFNQYGWHVWERR